MKKVAAVLFLSLCMALADHLGEFTTSNREFSANIYKELAADNSGNFVACPISTQIVLSMVHAGARRQTAEELAKGLSIPNSSSEINAMIKAITPLLKSQQNLYTLEAVNKLYVADDLKISSSFKSTAVDVFKAAVENINFVEKIEATNKMNRWVAEQTQNNINNLIEPADIDSDTKAVILNAMYFQASWSKRFYEESTKKSNFYTSRIGNVEVDMMDRTSTFEYHESERLDAKFLKMSYIGSDMSMVVVLPNKKDGLSNLEASIDDVFQHSDYSHKQVHVKFPKFKMDATIKFIPILKKLGIVELFTTSADLTGITVDGVPLYITQVIQKNYVEVNEKGTIAASATAAIAGVGSSFNPDPPKEFFADHSFIYYIQSPAGILFVGRFDGH